MFFHYLCRVTLVQFSGWNEERLKPYFVVEGISCTDTTTPGVLMEVNTEDRPAFQIPGARVVLVPENSHLISKVLIRITPCMSSYCLLILNTGNCHIPAGICDSCLGNLPGALLFAACVSICKKTARNVTVSCEGISGVTLVWNWSQARAESNSDFSWSPRHTALLLRLKAALLKQVFFSSLL